MFHQFLFFSHLSIDSKKEFIITTKKTQIIVSKYNPDATIQPIAALRLKS